MGASARNGSAEGGISRILCDGSISARRISRANARARGEACSFSIANAGRGLLACTITCNWARILAERTLYASMRS
jgi:hypothetical protein